MSTFSKYTDKLFFKQWTIGICRGDLGEIIRDKKFDPDIKWLSLDTFDKFIADPFLLKSQKEGIKILYEDYPFDDDYGKISLLTLDKEFKMTGNKVLLDTGSHLSYPFIWYEDGKTYIFPEAARSGKLTCYEFNPESESLAFIRDIIGLPLRDSTIFKYQGKYWIFGIIADGDINYELHVFFSDSLMGPYTPHKKNPVSEGLDGIRPAGNFLVEGDNIFRPAQNCGKAYGESMVINKVTELSEENISEEPYLNITLDRKSRNNRAVHTIHTINQNGPFIVVDGEQWTFAPLAQIKKFIRYLPYFKKRRDRRISRREIKQL